MRITNLHLCMKLTNEFGPLKEWPAVSLRPPRFFSFLQRKTEKRICKVMNISKITQEMRNRYWEQVNAGQGYNDATGYKLRCWRAMVGWPFLPADISYSAIMHDEKLCEKYGMHYAGKG